MKGISVIDLEDMDQDLYTEWRGLDLMQRDLLDVQPEAPPKVILFYTLRLDTIRRKEYKSSLDNEGNDNVSD